MRDKRNEQKCGTKGGDKNKEKSSIRQSPFQWRLVKEWSHTATWRLKRRPSHGHAVPQGFPSTNRSVYLCCLTNGMHNIKGLSKQKDINTKSVIEI